MHDNYSANFILKGFTSILIGIYILIGSYALKTLLNGFLIDDNPVGMLSVEILEILGITIVFLVLLFSSLALYFSGKRVAKRNDEILFNSQTKTILRKYIIGVVIIFATLILVKSRGYLYYITPTFLLLYSLLLFLLKNKERKNLLILSGLCLLLAILCILIPSYWYSSLAILGVAHLTYGVVVK